MGNLKFDFRMEGYMFYIDKRFVWKNGIYVKIYEYEGWEGMLVSICVI